MVKSELEHKAQNRGKDSLHLVHIYVCKFYTVYKDCQKDQLRQ